MRLCCSTTILDRNLPTLSIKATKKYKNSILCVSKLSKRSEPYLIITTQNKKSNYRYKILKNIERTFGQFINEGKFTIRFKEPPHDVSISAEKIPLQNFKLYIGKVLRNQESNIPTFKNNFTFNSIKNSAKLEILKRKDYLGLKRFKSTLEYLMINNCEMKKLDSRILQLKNLTCLDLSKNNLQELPYEFGNLLLKQLILSDNDLGSGNWLFLSNAMAETIQFLDISCNKITTFPGNITRLSFLKTLKINGNLLTNIPFQLCKLPQLETLDVSNNRLRALPANIRRKNCKKLATLDLSGELNFTLSSAEMNYFFDEPSPKKEKKGKHNKYLSSLLELSGKFIIDSKIKYNEEILPNDLVKLLDNAGQCFCGETTINKNKIIYCEAESMLLASTIISSQHLSVVPIMFVSCSPL